MYSLSTIKHVGKKATKILPHVELIVKSHTVQHNQASKKTMQLVKNFEQACDCFNNGSFTVKNT